MDNIVANWSNSAGHMLWTTVDYKNQCTLDFRRGLFSASAVYRPPDIVCRRTYILPSFLSFFFLSFFRQLLSELAERNSTISGHMVGSKCNLKMHVRNLGYPFPLQIVGPKITFSSRLRNSTATLTALILGIKHGIHKWTSALQTTRVLLHRLKTI